MCSREVPTAVWADEQVSSCISTLLNVQCRLGSHVKQIFNEIILFGRVVAQFTLVLVIFSSLSVFKLSVV